VKNNKHFLLILLLLFTFQLKAQYYNVAITETGVSQLIIFSSSITDLTEGLEIGIYDENGLNTDDCSSQSGEVLVGAGVWLNEQLEISVIGSLNLCSYSGWEMPGYIENHSIVVRIWDSIQLKEYSTSFDVIEGAPNYSSSLSTVISNLDLGECILNCECEGNVEDCTGECGGSAIEDCDGVCNGNAEFDECGVCGGLGSIYECGCTDIPEGECDCAGNIDLGCGCGEAGPSGCDQTCGSTLENDICNVCGGSGIPDGDCDCSGNVLDECGLCGGSGITEGACDCAGNVLDDCGICDGPGETEGCGCDDIPAGDCDCAGNVDLGCGCGEAGPSGCDQTCGSTLENDICNVCGGSGIPDGDCDCAGNVDLGCGCDEDGPSGCDETCGSILENDVCAVCDGPGSTYECGCADMPEGDCDCVENVLDECGVCGGVGSTCAAYIESSITTTIDEAYLDDMDIFKDLFSAFIEIALGLPSGTVEVINVTILARGAAEIEVEFTITLTGEELALTDYESTAEIADSLENTENEIEDGGMMFIYGCTDSGADNYVENALIDDGSCTYLAIYYSQIPKDYSLATYPNPFNPITSILFSLTQMDVVSIKAYDIRGKELETITNRNMIRGNYTINWDASAYPSGIYFVKMMTTEFTKVQKLMLVK